MATTGQAQASRRPQNGRKPVDGGGASAGGWGDWRRMSQTQRQGGEIQNLGGEPCGFIGATGMRREIVRLDLRACHAHRRVTSRDTRPQSLSLPIENHGGRFAFQANPDSLPAWGRQVTKIFSILARLGPRSSAAGPTKGGSTKRSKIKGAGITGISIHGQAPVRSALNGIPTNGIPRPSRKND